MWMKFITLILRKSRWNYWRWLTNWYLYLLDFRLRLLYSTCRKYLTVQSRLSTKVNVKELVGVTLFKNFIYLILRCKEWINLQALLRYFTNMSYIVQKIIKLKPCKDSGQSISSCYTHNYYHISLNLRNRFSRNMIYRRLKYYTIHKYSKKFQKRAPYFQFSVERNPTKCLKTLKWKEDQTFFQTKHYKNAFARIYRPLLRKNFLVKAQIINFNFFKNCTTPRLTPHKHCSSERESIKLENTCGWHLVEPK